MRETETETENESENQCQSALGECAWAAMESIQFAYTQSKAEHTEPDWPGPECPQSEVLFCTR